MRPTHGGGFGSFRAKLTVDKVTIGMLFMHLNVPRRGSFVKRIRVARQTIVRSTWERHGTDVPTRGVSHRACSQYLPPHSFDIYVRKGHLNHSHKETICDGLSIGMLNLIESKQRTLVSYFNWHLPSDVVLSGEDLSRPRRFATEYGKTSWSESSGLYRNYSSLDRDEYSFSTIADFQLLSYVVQVIPDSKLAYLECIGYFFVCEPLCH